MKILDPTLQPRRNDDLQSAGSCLDPAVLFWQRARLRSVRGMLEATTHCRSWTGQSITKFASETTGTGSGHDAPEPRHDQKRGTFPCGAFEQD